jgi:hypothetical protein
MPVKHCPACGRENDLDSLRCIRCGVALPGPEESPPGAEPEARSVVLATFDNHLSAQAAANHLEDAGIPVVVNADDCGGLYPFLTPALGIRLLVKASDLPRARDAMTEMEAQFGIKADSVAGATGEPSDLRRPPHQPRPHLAKLGFLLLGAVMGALSHYAVTLHRSNFTGTKSEDRNGDGRPDAWWVYEGGQIVKFSEDRNYDGRPDSWVIYSNGIIQSDEDDTDFDGRPDVWFDYEHGEATRRREDLDYDGRPDSETRYVARLPVTTVFAASNKLGYWRRDFFTNGILRETHLDRDRDGTLDERHVFDAFGTFLRVEPMK